MFDGQATDPNPQSGGAGRRKELTHFLFLAFGVWPLVAVGVVGGYGFLVWMFQLIAGPPGPPGY
ncbi:periplasmic nitrate reductase, NapE protein [Pseudophaeobacter flagellatus]|uniref:periplasmic nitrate reductase, NapE protein n=1 Tax=Pseudophaeobacter flagellatus TaxID=2899119 RepID=UPI0022B69232|nr:periplasmic nitrate reductase, NapE protein [Pseudophaeobacter flagellatus]